MRWRATLYRKLTGNKAVLYTDLCMAVHINFENLWKIRLCREKFCVLLAFAMPKDATPQILRRKLSRIATKPQNSWRKFCPSKVSCMLYGMRHMHMYAKHFWRWSIQESLSFFFHGHINYFLQESLRFLELDTGAGQTTPTIVAQAACRHICIINSLFLSGFSVFFLLPTSSFQLWQLWQHRVFHENILFWLKIVMYIMYCCSTACLDKTLCLWSTILMIFFFLHFRCTVSMR